MSKTDQERRNAINLLLTHYQIEPNTVIYTRVEHVARGGMSREISCYIVTPESRIANITYQVATAINATTGKHNGIKMHGCGMDMGFETVYRLGNALWPNGTPQPHGTRNGKPDTAGGYALNHQWL